MIGSIFRVILKERSARVIADDQPDAGKNIFIPLFTYPDDFPAESIVFDRSIVVITDQSAHRPIGRRPDIFNVSRAGAIFHRPSRFVSADNPSDISGSRQQIGGGGFANGSAAVFTDKISDARVIISLQTERIARVGAIINYAVVDADRRNKMYEM